MSDRADSLRLEPAEAALLVIDMQNGFCHPEGSRGQAFGPDSVAQPRSIVAPIIGLIRSARGVGIPIWFTRQVHYPDDVGRTRRRIPSHLDRRGLKLELCRRGTWDAELIDEIAAEVRPEDEVLVKHRASAFYNTGLETELRMKARQILIVTGTTTSYCVESTVRDAYARDFDVIVPRDCVADTDPDAQEASLKSVDRFHGLVTSAEDVAKMFGLEKVSVDPDASVT